MKVSELGEFGLIDLLTKMVNSSQEKVSRQQLIIGIGDDTAAWHGDTSTQLATVDSLIQDVHFSLGITPWHELGWKALAANQSHTQDNHQKSLSSPERDSSGIL